MNYKLPFPATCLLAVALVGMAFAAAPGDFNAAREGRELAARILQQRPLPEASATLTTRDAGGNRRLFDVRLHVAEIGSNHWSSIYDATPRGESPQGGRERLKVIRQEGQPSQYEYETRLGAEGSPAKLSMLQGARASVPFSKSDFWLSDLGMEFLAWPEQRVLRHEIKKSRSCKVLESLNTSQESEDYARVVSWVDIETGNLLRAEAFDAQGKRRKEFTVSKVAKAQGRWQVREIRIYDYKTDSSTTLEFELDVPEP